MTTKWRLELATSASGAMMGMDSTARPEEDGTKNDSSISTQ